MTVVSEDVLAILAGTPLFEGVSREELEQVASRFQERRYAEGSGVVTEGAAGVEFFVVLDGTADIEAGGATVGSLGRGDFFGEVAALDQGPRTASVRATSALRCLALPNGALPGFLVDHPRVAVNMLYVTVRRFQVAMTSGRRPGGGAAQ
jgi:CRP-like cAMP-binding protein